MKRLLVLMTVIMSGVGPAASMLDAPVYRPLITIERGAVWTNWDFPERFSFGPAGTRIAAAATDSTVNIWEVQTGAVLQAFRLEDATAPSMIAWSPDGSRLAVGTITSREISVWDVASGALLYSRIPGYSAAWSPDSSRFATQSRTIYDADTGLSVFQIDTPYPQGCQVYWSPDGAMLATTTCHDADYLTVWSVPDGGLVDTYWGGRFAAWSPDSTRLASEAQVRDIATGLPVTIMPEMGGAIAWHPNGAWIASTGDGQQVSLWDATSGDLLTAWDIPYCEVRSLAWSPDGDRFAVNCIHAQRNDLIIWERVP